MLKSGTSNSVSVIIFRKRRFRVTVKREWFYDTDLSSVNLTETSSLRILTSTVKTLILNDVLKNGGGKVVDFSCLKI